MAIVLDNVYNVNFCATSHACAITCSNHYNTYYAVSVHMSVFSVCVSVVGQFCQQCTLRTFDPDNCLSLQHPAQNPTLSELVCSFKILKLWGYHLFRLFAADTQRFFSRGSWLIFSLRNDVTPGSVKMYVTREWN